MKYTLEYLFGLKSLSGKKAALGTIFHRCFELRGQAGMAKRKGLKSITDEDFGDLKVTDLVNNKKVLDLCFDHYTKIESHHSFNEADKKTIYKWIENTLTTYPKYDPLKLNIIATEQYFDFEIPDEWAKFEGEINGQKISGQLAIKGTMDKILDIGNNVYELLDYKTGALRKDFATGEEKTLEYLSNDVQLLLYLIAMKRLWPDKEFILSLFYINNGGIFSVYADDDMHDRAIDMLKKIFRKITATNRPRQLDPSHSDWRCKYCCDFSKKIDPNSNLSVCNYYKKQIDENGLQNVMGTVVDLSKFGLYVDGGGRKNVET